ncbi:helix-turn-helix domain-containing protein [Frigidibacter sp.]|uniref:helix-turn-helix domain-containing protein n=1 Tax=Frigidibacter sp. TaxID=2586418 RepID=UPI00273738E8|nr:helix-turn-helix domain-containing protein [Frigidibacter sp.]MDP3340013.1 helix-turn-helix domain-containing protein [Frigidibacter sp.]
MSESTPLPAAQVIALLVLPQTPMLAIAAVIDPLREANAVLEHEAYVWRLLSSASLGAPLADGSEPAYAGSTPDAAGADALIVLAGPWQGWMDSRALLRPIRRVVPQIGCLGAVGGGVRVLAATGELDGIKVACTPEAAADLVAAHPAVAATAAPWAWAKSRMTAATPLGGTGMMLQMLRARHGADPAGEVAARLGWPVSASAPATTSGTGGDPRVAAAIAQMQASIAAPQSAAAIAQGLGISSRRLEGLFRAELGTGPGAYALDLRLAAARALVEAGTEPLAAIAAATGFSSAGTLARAFRSRYDISPSALRRQADSQAPAQG